MRNRWVRTGFSCMGLRGGAVLLGALTLVLGLPTAAGADDYCDGRDGYRRTGRHYGSAGRGGRSPHYYRPGRSGASCVDRSRWIDPGGRFRTSRAATPGSYRDLRTRLIVGDTSFDYTLIPVSHYLLTRWPHVEAPAVEVTEDPPVGLAAIDGAVKPAPVRPETDLLQAVRHVHLGEHTAARDLADGILRKQPKHEAARYLRCFVDLMQGRTAQTNKALLGLFEDGVIDGSERIQADKVFADVDRWRRARRSVDELRRWQPSHTDAHLLRTYIALLDGNATRARLALRTAVRRKADHPLIPHLSKAVLALTQPATAASSTRATPAESEDQKKTDAPAKEAPATGLRPDSRAGAIAVAPAER